MSDLSIGCTVARCFILGRQGLWRFKRFLTAQSIDLSAVKTSKAEAKLAKQLKIHLMWEDTMTTVQDFFAAIEAGSTVEVTRLLDASPALVNARDENGLSAVLTAAYYQESDIAKLLVQRGAELSVFEACAVGELSRVKEWVERQPDLINAYAPDGFQPLGLAAFFGHIDVVEFLLSKGAEVNSPSRNPMRVMPLHSAIANKHTDIVKLLLDHGADVNAAQADDFTPLHESAQNDMLDVTRWLLDHGASLNPRLASNGKTPLALAIEHKHESVAELLQQHGATT